MSRRDFGCRVSYDCGFFVVFRRKCIARSRCSWRLNAIWPRTTETKKSIICIIVKPSSNEMAICHRYASRWCDFVLYSDIAPYNKDMFTENWNRMVKVNEMKRYEKIYVYRKYIWIYYVFLIDKLSEKRNLWIYRNALLKGAIDSHIMALLAYRLSPALYISRFSLSKKMTTCIYRPQTNR